MSATSLTRAWLILLAVTAVTYWIGESGMAGHGSLTLMLVLFGLTFVKGLVVSLDFLEKGKTYKAIIYADGEKADWKTNPTEYQITEQEVTADDTLNIRMAAGGGQAISFMPLQK